MELRLLIFYLLTSCEQQVLEEAKMELQGLTHCLILLPCISVKTALWYYHLSSAGLFRCSAAAHHNFTSGKSLKGNRQSHWGSPLLIPTWVSSFEVLCFLSSPWVFTLVFVFTPDITICFIFEALISVFTGWFLFGNAFVLGGRFVQRFLLFWQCEQIINFSC